MPGAKRARTTAAVVVLFLVLTLLTSCWSSFELEQRAVVAALGVDRGRDGRLLVTAQILRPDRAARRPGAAQGGGSEGPPVLVMSAEARTVAEAIRIISKDIGRDLFFSEMEFIAVGEELARKGVEPVTDWVTRNRQLRLATWFVVTPGTAREVVGNTTEMLERVPSFNIGRIIRSTAQQKGFRVPPVRLLDFLQALARPGMEPLAIRLSVEEARGQRQVQATGSAAFQGYRLVGWLTETESRGYLWFRGEVRRGSLSAPLPGGDFVAFEIRGSRTTLTSEIRDGQPEIKLKINVKGAVEEVHNPALFLDRPETIDDLEPLMENQIRLEAQAALDRARELGADIFGFGEVIRRQHREVWAELREDWKSHFPHVPVEIEVKATLRRTQQIEQPISPGQALGGCPYSYSRAWSTARPWSVNSQTTPSLTTRPIRERVSSSRLATNSPGMSRKRCGIQASSSGFNRRP